MLRYIITPLVLACLALPAAADDVQLQPDRPERYVVVKGDTLWAISGKFLKDPWKWPKVWNMNREQIKNPHLIYPGDVVVLDTSSGEPQLRLLRETVTLQPGIREEPLDREAVPSISPSTIAPFLSRPLIVEPDSLKESPTIIAGPQNRVAYAPGNKVYIDKMPEDQGNVWHIYRPGKIMVDPENKEPLGLEALYLGDLKVIKFGDPATGEITRAKEEIFSDDRLVKVEDKLQFNYIPHAPESEIKGRIMAIYGGVAEAGANTIISINKGKADGLEEGHVLSINRAGTYVSRKPTEKKAEEKFKLPEFRFKDVDPNEEKNKKPQSKSDEKYDPKKDPANDKSLVKLPDERIGLLMVFRTFDRVSYGLIMQAAEPVNLLDTVNTP
ncbi:LysM peptidoglycan-binding domain-containing protein [Methylovorus menthalis]|uniref:LysM peptidoglycan-binding domain-containing protein n=1 Tax=Methylovorus menthalis TaxID=1002227 RepID=UPI001E5DD9A4|nr:LysM peptidoglycan-binding domain-containing protein [Methylovorus menthalis]MCB4810714.1 LysM peptidoglycan-binding domain-containing protein [Methylovorus menthalis]